MFLERIANVFFWKIEENLDFSYLDPSRDRTAILYSIKTEMYYQS
jgi:hypothetical protein